MHSLQAGGGHQSVTGPCRISQRGDPCVLWVDANHGCRARVQRHQSAQPGLFPRARAGHDRRTRPIESRREASTPGSQGHDAARHQCAREGEAMLAASKRRAQAEQCQCTSYVTSFSTHRKSRHVHTVRISDSVATAADAVGAAACAACWCRARRAQEARKSFI